jgi:predicted membrane channel-forming protein YqfA (hemolysin III family)
MKINWGKYLWKLRLLLFIPFVLLSVFMFKSIDNDTDMGRYWLVFAVYVTISNIILYIMERKEKKEKQNLPK